MVEGPVVSAADTSVTIRWKTDVVCGARASAGLEQGSHTHKAEGPVGLDHEVTFTGLSPSSTYHYRIGTARVKLHEGTFSTKEPGAARPPPETPKAKAAQPANAPANSPKPVRAVAPSAKQTWGSYRTLQDHYDRHGADFNATSPDDYARQAWEFLQRAINEELPAKLDDSDGTIRVWDPKTRAFAAYNRNGTTKTYFKPGSPDYFSRQPGRSITLRRPDPSPR